MINLKSLKVIALALSIIIVLNLFINIGIKTFYPAPKLEEYCDFENKGVYDTEDSCEEVGGKWITGNSLSSQGGVVMPRSIDGEFKNYCNVFFSCRGEYEDAREFYERNVFIVLIIAGLIALGVGYGIQSTSSVSSGFIFGGVLSFIIGTIRYWSNMDDYLRFIILGIVLIILIWIGYKKINKD